MAAEIGGFVHLGARSEFSVGESFAAAEELCRTAARHGQAMLGLTDVVTLAAGPRFQKSARAAGVRPIFGLELPVSPTGSEGPVANPFRVRVLAESAHGWRSLVRLSNIARLSAVQAPAFSRMPPQVSLDALREESRGLILLIGGMRGEVTKLLAERDFERAVSHVLALREAWNESSIYFEIPDPVGAGGAATARMLVSAAEHFGFRTVAVPQVCAADLPDEMAWRFFQRDPIVRLGANRDPRVAEPLPERMGDLIVPVEERCSLIDSETALRRFAEFPEAAAATLEIAERCGEVSIPEPEKRFPVHSFTRGVDAESFIWNTAFERAGARYGELPAAIKDRLNHEFRHLVDAGLANAVVSLARLHEEFESRGILSGPGSGIFTGSLVASLLGITRLDPIAFGLRFQLPESVGTRVPPLEFSIPALQEKEAIAALSDLFAGQVCSPGRWQRWRFGGALEAVGSAAGLSSAQRSALVHDKAQTEARERENRPTASLPPDPDTRIAESEGALWLARRLEGRPRTLAAVPGRFFLTVDPILGTLPVREEPAREGTMGRVCEWSEEELTTLRYGGAVARNLALLDLVGEATASARLSEGSSFTPARFASDDEEAFAFIRAGMTSGVAPFEPPSARHLLRTRSPQDVVSLARACEGSAEVPESVDLPSVLLGFTAVALKAHRPVPFYAAALTQAGVDTRRLTALLNEARSRGIPVQPLDINCSDWNWTAEGRTVRPGFCVVRDLPQTAAREIIALRRELAFDDLADLLRRADPTKLRDGHVELLLRAGALDGFGLGRAQLGSLLERLLPLLRPKRAERHSGGSADPLEFFGQTGSWWLREQEGIEEGTRPDRPAAREGESDATSGVWLSPPEPNATESKFIVRAGARQRLGPKDDGRRVCLLGFVDACEAESADPDAVLLEFAGATCSLRGPLAKRASSGALAGKPCLLTGIARRNGRCWEIDAEDFDTLESYHARASRARAIHIDAASRAPEIQHATYAVLKEFPGTTTVRLSSRPVRLTRALGRLEGRRVTLAPMLEIELNALLGPGNWRVEEPELMGRDSLHEVSPNAGSLVRRMFDTLVGGRK